MRLSYKMIDENKKEPLTKLEKLREIEIKYLKVFESSHDIILTLDRAGNIIDINRRAEQLTGYPQSELLKMNVFRHLYVPEDCGMMRQVIEDAFKGLDSSYQVRWRTKEGKILHFDGLTVPLLSAHGEVLSTLCTLRDITVRKLAQEALKQAQSHMESILHSITDIYILFDRQWRYLYVNKAAVRAIGRPREQILGRTLWELYPDIVGTELDRQYHRAMVERLSVFFEFYYATTNSWWENRFYPAPEGLAAFATDITERKRAEEKVINRSKVLSKMNEEMRKQRERLRVLAARLAEAEEKERKRLAMELHDQVGQNLTAIGINLSIIRTELPKEMAEPLQVRFDDTIHLLEQTTERIRNVMAELRPPVLDDYGLMAALRWYVTQFSVRTGISVTVKGDDIYPRLAARVENVFFRIFQEALTNVSKHARAGNVEVSVQQGEASLSFVISDDGVGFDPLERPTGCGGWGLFNMKERAMAIGGRFKVESGLGRGARIIVSVQR